MPAGIAQRHKTDDDDARQTVLAVALLNLAYFGIEFSAALAVGSVSLFADSIDFLEDVSINLLILAALAWSARRRAYVGMALAAMILVPGLATLWTAWEKLHSFVPPEPFTLSLVGMGAMAVNGICAVLLARHRHAGSSLMKAAFLSARNDVLANVAIVAAGIATLCTVSPLPDLVVGLGIAAINADAAREVYAAARKEAAEAEA